MWHKLFCIIYIINTLTSAANGIHISEYNETRLILEMNSQISELRTVQEHQNKLIEELFKATDLQVLKAEQERQGKLIEDLVKATDIQNRQEKLIDGLVKATDIQSLKAELEEQKRDGADKDSKIKFLTEELARLSKLMGDLNKQFNNQSLRVKQKEQKMVIEEVVKESDKDNLKPQTVNCTGAKSNGIYEILLSKFSSQPLKVACDAVTQGGGWTIILRRMGGSEDFYRNWTEYKKGFGDLSGEFFLGLDKIHALTTERKQELLVVLQDDKGNEVFEKYAEFAIGNEDQQYILHTLGKAGGSAGDSLSYHLGSKFSTYDRDNDNHNRNCAELFTGGWWYFKCHFSNLAGNYNGNRYGAGVNWHSFKGMGYSLKRAVMMIRPKK
ncbi:microfibril-associated glycoprotein 4-like [Drosophila innubila]|uniref:microfibril-associated glycoprotein 4-like n=1 Tax=Drosophila innubila TaxID=198719 RepID=UPI00148B648A|nr:microfibril-associated glycoprotein 4-like [Drosophila innubila]